MHVFVNSGLTFDFLLYVAQLSCDTRCKNLRFEEFLQRGHGTRLALKCYFEAEVELN
jgi:hypothetical protein